jgi:AcrR family transcriptional regulator
MSERTVDWAALRRHRAGERRSEGLRERKKRLMRQQLSDTATEMFLERGFDAVRVSDVAAACGVSEKTVFNYFPTKEALILDRWDTTMASLRADLAEPNVSPVEATVQILADELGAELSWLDKQQDPLWARAAVRRFAALIEATPSLRAHQRDVMDQLIVVAADVLAGRVGLAPDDPEPRIAATALLGLWQIHILALKKYLDDIRTLAEIRDAVTAEVQRAAQLIDAGLSTFGALAERAAGHGQARQIRTNRACRV